MSRDSFAAFLAERRAAPRRSDEDLRREMREVVERIRALLAERRDR